MPGERATPSSPDEDQSTGKMVVAPSMTKMTIRKWRKRCELLFARSMTPIFLLDPCTMTFREVNRAAIEMTGFREDELVGAHLSDLLPSEVCNIDSLLTNVEDSADSEEELCMLRTQVSTKSGECRIVNASISCCGYRDRPLIQLMTHDVTDTLQMESHKRQLVQADKMVAVGTLASGIAHEINNPNNCIYLNAGLVFDAWRSVSPILDDYFEKNGDFDMGGLEYSEMRGEIEPLIAGISDGAERIKSIVDGLKSYVRIAPDTMSEDVDINSVVTSALALVGSQVKRSTRRCHVSYAQDLPAVKGNFQRLEQVIINLVQNACHALSSRDQSLTLTTSHMGEVGLIRIEVKDEGSGMSDETMRRIMDPFFTTKMESGGTGMGLAVSSGIIKDHGGTLNFGSMEGEGTTAVIMLPVGIPA